jgi:signal transduction histidine kinase
MPTKLWAGKFSPFRSLLFKFSLVVIILFVLIFGLLSFTFIRNFTSAEKNSLLNQARAFSTLSTQPIGDTYNIYYSSGYLKFKELVEENLSLNKDIQKIQIINVDGEVLFDSNEFKTGSKTTKITDQSILSKVAANSSSEVKHGSEIKEIVEPFFEDFGAHPFSIRYFISYDSINKTVANIRNTALLLTLIFLGFSIGFIVIITNRLFLSPIKKVVEAAKAISGGDLSREIAVKTGDEVEELASSVNHMAQTLRSNIEALKELDKLKDEFIMIASHNLRTPLVAIQGYLEYFKNASLESSLQKYVTHIDTSLKELSNLTEELIGIVSMESKREGLAKQETDMKELLEEAARSFSSPALEKRINIVFEFPESALPKLNIDKFKMVQAVNNLIDNAIKFNKESGQVIISAKKKDKDLLVSVADTGIGIEKEKEHLVFGKFARGTSILRYDYTGTGLGLYITKLIINAHGGKIWFESTPGKGATFHFTLPIK